MDKDVFERFDALASALLAHVAELAPEVPAIVAETIQARDEALGILNKAATHCTSDGTRAVFVEPGRRLVRTSEQILDVNKRLDALVRESVACSKHVANWKANFPGLLDRIQERALSEDEKFAVANFTAALASGPATWKFFAGVPTIAMVAALTNYRDTAIAFLGRPPGKRYDLRAGLDVLLQAGADTLIDAATFNFGSTLLRTAEAALISPAEKDIAAMRGAVSQLERVFQLKSALAKLDTQMGALSVLLATSEAAIKDSVSDIGKYGAVITEGLTARGGPGG